MQDNVRPIVTEEIVLSELLYALWNHKIFILAICLTGIFLGGYYALKSDKEYTASADFKLKDPTTSNAGSELEAFANIVGFGNALGSELNIPFAETMGRNFILDLDKKVNFQKDTFFYRPNEDKIEPVWKTFIKSLINWESRKLDQNELMWQSIISKYKKHVELKASSEGDSLIVSVTHENSRRAAQIANSIMESLIESAVSRSEIEQTQQLDYLSKTLADALIDLENGQSRLKNFALENNPRPLENYALKTQTLDNLRKKFSRTTNINLALAEILLLMNNKTTSYSDYLTLRETFPIVDQIEFRQVLGQNEVISSWTWPEKAFVTSVFETISERQKRLEAKVNTAQLVASEASKSLERYTTIKRESTIADASYNVILEQVKAMSIMSGYEPNRFEIYEYAAAPINYSSPKLSLSLALGAVLGLFIGCTLSLIYAKYRGVYYSSQNLIYNAQSDLNVKARTLRSMLDIPMAKFTSKLTKKSQTTLRDLAVEINRNSNNLVLFTSLNSRLKGFDVANATAKYMQSEDLKIGLLNFNSKFTQHINHENATEVGSYSIIKKLDEPYIVHPTRKIETSDLIAVRDFTDQLHKLQANFDLMFLSADNGVALSLASALSEQDVSHITIARTKRTSSKSLIKIRELLPIQGLLYE